MKVYKVKVNGKVYEVELEAVEEKAGSIEAPQAVSSAPSVSQEAKNFHAPLSGKFSDIKVILEKEEKEGKKVVGLVFSINKNDYRYPIDHWLEYEQYNKKTKGELQKALNGLILARYKQTLDKTKIDLFCKEAILQLVMELKNNEYEDSNIKHPIPYFVKILQEKHKQFTGEEISNTDLRRYEMQQLMEESGYPPFPPKT